MSRLHPNSKSTATRTAKDLEAAASDLEHAVQGLRNAARCYRERHDTDAGPMNLKSSMSLIRMACHVVWAIAEPAQTAKYIKGQRIK